MPRSVEGCWRGITAISSKDGGFEGSRGVQAARSRRRERILGEWKGKKKTDARKKESERERRQVNRGRREAERKKEREICVPEGKPNERRDPAKIDQWRHGTAMALFTNRHYGGVERRKKWKFAPTPRVANTSRPPLFLAAVQPFLDFYSTPSLARTIPVSS